ncbi:hypothetical protein AB0C51_04995 [Streptomyces pathocidini]|uniref:hypothetical protein n=1 Tax=Streptomyces pathocidini TaxID=1650571 RepID=UPI0033E79715
MSRASRGRTAAGLALLLAALVVGLLPLPSVSQARAAEAETSAVTKEGVQGLHDDFSDLRVTVHQTRDLRAQGVRITWSGAAPTQQYSNANILQVMQCWGEAETGPRREQCQFGALNKDYGAGLGSTLREVQQDPGETDYVPDPAHPFDVPFVPFEPADGGPATTDRTDDTYFSPLDTNEAPYLRTGADGTGETVFRLLTVVEASHLGCGESTGGGKGRACWLVVVPRGAHDADGSTATLSNKYDSSPLSATNWAQRIVFKLDFLPVGESCPLGQPERPAMGSELATDAMTSWLPKLCGTTGSTFQFNQSGEDYARTQLSGASSDPLLAFTVDPVRIEGEGAPEVVHAPTAVSGVAVAFLIEDPRSSLVHEIRLTPRLLAKMLTGSYLQDTALTGQDPQYLEGNPVNWRADPEFLEVNPRLADWVSVSGPTPESLIVSIENSDVNRLVWHWLQSDDEAKAFLSGSPDPWGMKINPNYQELGLATDGSIDGFPKADPFTRLANEQYEASLIGITDVQPYANDMHDAALRALRGDSGRKTFWDLGTPPKLTNGGGQLPGRRTQIAIVDAASAARYGLQTAALRNADGTFVQPTAESLLAGVESMKDSEVAGVLAPDPGAAKGGAYPLTAVTYAAASKGMAQQDRTAYAQLIRYAAGDGQVLGYAPGELPPGYVPLPAGLRDRAEAAAAALEKPDPAGEDPTSGGTGNGGAAAGGSTGSASESGSDGGLGADASVGGAATGGDGGASADGGGAAGAPGGSSEGSGSGADRPGGGDSGKSPADQQNVAKSGGLTPSEVLGVLRWVLLGVLVLGAAAALAGPLLLRFSVRRPSVPG